MSKIALVTGGTRGIGRGISIALKEAGYTVAANYNKDEETAKMFFEETSIPVFSWNVSSFEECERGIREVKDKLGSDIDILINNAGITRDAMLHKMDSKDWNSVIGTNLNSIFNMCRLIIPSMRDRKYGRIVNMSSVNGVKGQVGQTNYSAAKAGIIGFTKALALECASKGITVNAIAPGYIRTDMTDTLSEEIKAKIVSTIPVGRFGQVDDITRAVMFLVAEEASFITGTTLNINGGQYFN